MNRNYEDKTLRTSSYKKQNAYDRLIADCIISSLRFLSDKYQKDLNNYKENYDLEEKDNWIEYKRMQERKKMIDEELTVRIMNKNASPTSYYSEFDSTTGTVFINDEINNNHTMKTVDFNEDEDGYIITDEDGYSEEVDSFYNLDYKRKRKDVYREWKY